MDLVEFLNARYDDQEATARAAVDDERGATSHWEATGRGWVEYRDKPGDIVVYDEGSPSDEQAQHIAANDPASVLLDLASKRALLQAILRWSHDDMDDGGFYSCALVQDPRRAPSDATCTCGLDARRNQIVQILARPFAGHPDYRPEWMLYPA